MTKNLVFWNSEKFLGKFSLLEFREISREIYLVIR